MGSYGLKLGMKVISLVYLVTGLLSIRAESNSGVPPEFIPVTWLPSLIPTLTKAGFACEGIILAPGRIGIQKEDTVTMLVQASEGESLRQWAAALIINPQGPKEKAYFSTAQTFYINNGNRVVFGPTQLEGMAIHVIGPFSKSKGPADSKDVWSGTLINPQFLGLGLEATPAMFIRVKEKWEADPVLMDKVIPLSAESRPFSKEQVAASKALIERYAITPAEERSFAGCSPALMNFFTIAVQTPGVREILREAVDISLLQLVAHGGRVEVNFELLGPVEKLSAMDWGLPPEMNVYSMGIRVLIYGKPALLCRLAVTTPCVPLLNCAGIVGISAMRPNGKGPRMMMRVMAAKRRPPSSPNSGPSHRQS